MIHLKNGIWINPNTFKFTASDLWIEEGENGKLSFEMPANTENCKSIDCSGKFITRAFANGHHHVYSALARGMHPPKKSPENFTETLEYIWWVLDQCLDYEMIRASALTTAIACAKHGCTFVIDHHASPNSLIGSQEIIAKAFEEIGVGHLLCYEITDRYGESKAKEALDETDSYLQNHQGLVGLHASFTVEDNTLKESIKLAQKHKTGIHVHVAEDIADGKHALEQYGKSVVERFRDFEMLDLQKNIFAHGIHLNKTERELIAQSTTYMVVNTDSNLNNRVGIFNSKGLGNRIMLGTDGMHSDMIKSTQTALFAGQNFDQISWLDAYQRLQNAHTYLNSNQFKGDNENNVIVLDYDSPTELTPDNFLGHFFFGFESRHIQHVISSGKLIVENRILKTADEESILKESHKIAHFLWNKMQKM
jgi:cytosine/adenosine deaminase-related metal-dependent hydrolase